MPFTKYLHSGNIGLEDYSKFLYQKVQLYKTLEEVASYTNLLDDHPDLPRYYRCNHDYEELVGQSIKHAFLPATKEYCDYIANLNDPSKVKAHMFVAYDDDLLNGFKYIENVPGSGSMYEFGNYEQTSTKFLTMLDDSLAEEALMGFNFHAAMYRQLEETRIFV